MTDTTNSKKGLSRRGLLKAGAAATGAAIGSGLITGFPSGHRTRLLSASSAPASPTSMPLPRNARQTSASRSK